MPLRFMTDAGMLSFISTTTVFGTPVEVTLSELAVESFYPADAATPRCGQSGRTEALGGGRRRLLYRFEARVRS